MLSAYQISNDTAIRAKKDLFSQFSILIQIYIYVFGHLSE